MVKNLFIILGLGLFIASCTSQTMDECLEGTHHSSFALIHCQAMAAFDE